MGGSQTEPEAAKGLSYSLIIQKKALIELEHASDWYEIRRPGLGEEFESEIDACISAIRINPFAFQLRYDNVRIVFSKRFDYGVHYFIEGRIIKVVACLHMKQNID